MWEVIGPEGLSSRRIIERLCSFIISASFSPLNVL